MLELDIGRAEHILCSSIVQLLWDVSVIHLPVVTVTVYIGSSQLALAAPGHLASCLVM